MKKVFVRNPYNYDMDEASNESGLKCEDVSLAQQQFVEESDINTIVERFGLNGELPSVLRAPTYGDYTGIGDFQSAMNAVLAAQANFMELPAKVRARFSNDPQQFLEFVQDEANRAEAEALGLLNVIPKGSAPVAVVPEPPKAP